MSIFQTVRSCLAKPEFWVLTGTTLPPLNVCWAAGFVLVARWRRHPDAPALSRCLNIQITYTLLLAAPVFCGSAMARWRITQEAFVPGSGHALAAGLALGFIGAAAILSLVFINTRAFTESVRGRERTSVPHLRFLRE